MATLKQFVGNLPTNCLSVFDHFVKLALKGLSFAHVAGVFFHNVTPLLYIGDFTLISFRRDNYEFEVATRRKQKLKSLYNENGIVLDIYLFSSKFFRGKKIGLLDLGFLEVDLP